MTCSLEYNNEIGIRLYTDFIVVGENQETFDLAGDSGSVILLTSNTWGTFPSCGIVWGRLILKAGQFPENWTSGVELGRLLDVLELGLITSTQGLTFVTKKSSRSSRCTVRLQDYIISANKFSRLIVQELVLNEEFHKAESSPQEVGAAIEHQFIPLQISGERCFRDHLSILVKVRDFSIQGVKTMLSRLLGYFLQPPPV